MGWPRAFKKNGFMISWCHFRASSDLLFRCVDLERQRPLGDAMGLAFGTGRFVGRGLHLLRSPSEARCSVTSKYIARSSASFNRSPAKPPWEGLGYVMTKAKPVYRRLYSARALRPPDGYARRGGADLIRSVADLIGFASYGGFAHSRSNSEGGGGLPDMIRSLRDHRVACQFAIALAPPMSRNRSLRYRVASAPINSEAYGSKPDGRSAQLSAAARSIMNYLYEPLGEWCAVVGFA